MHHRNVIDYKHSWLENYQPAITGPLVPCLFILMEYADYGNVMDYIIPNDDDNDNDNDDEENKSKRKWLTEHEIWTIMFETCMGLQHLHEYGIVHRDIKPGNLLMTSLHTRHRIDFEDLELYDTNYRIVISDLGQSDFMDSDQRAPRTGNTGTLGFAAPELILKGYINDCANNDNMEDKEGWDESVDIWSLGHLLYFLTFSCWPYEDINCDDEQELYVGIISGKYKLRIPKYNGYRSQTIINMIDELCCIDKYKRPSLNWIIDSISNILKSHQYITITSTSSSSNLARNGNNNNNNKRKSRSRSRTPTRKRTRDETLDNPDELKRARSKSQEILISPQMALPPPPNIKPDLSIYPVVKYEPKKKINKKYKKSMYYKRDKHKVNKTSHINSGKYGNLLRKRRRNITTSLLKFDDENEYNKIIDDEDVDVVDDNNKDFNNRNDNNLIIQQLKMTMFVTVQKPFRFIIDNAMIKMSLCLMMKIQLILTYKIKNEYIVQIYFCVYLYVLSIIFGQNQNELLFADNIIKNKQYIYYIYGILSLFSYLYILHNDNDITLTTLKSIIMLISFEIILLLIHIYKYNLKKVFN